MTPEEFKEQVKDAADLYLTDYFTPEIEWDFEDPEDPRAYITVKMRDDSKPYILTVSISYEGEIGVECGKESWLTADDGGFMTALFFEAHERLRRGTPGSPLACPHEVDPIQEPDNARISRSVA